MFLNTTVFDTTTTVTAANATYDGLVHGATAVTSSSLAVGTTSFLYTGTGATIYNSSTAPTNAGTYHVVATFTPDNPAAFNPSSGFADFVINQAVISYQIGNATHAYGNTVNLATALGTTFSTGVNGENLAIAYSSVGNTTTSNVGSYAITGVASNGTGLASNYAVTLIPGALAVTQATLTGNASTQTAVNLAKDGKLKITVRNISGLLNGDTLSEVLSTATFYITVGANSYAFVPDNVTIAGDCVTITYKLKNSELADDMAAELADNTSAVTAAAAGFRMESENYTFTDSCLTRIFSSRRHC